MQRPHASDAVRERALAAVDAGHPVADVAAFFPNDPSKIYRWLRQRRAPGSGPARPRSGRPPLVPPEQRPASMAQVRAHPDATLAWQCQRWPQTHGIQPSRDAMSRWLLQLGLTRTKRR